MAMIMYQKTVELLVLPTIEHIENIVGNFPVEITKANYSSLEFVIKNNQATILLHKRDIKTFSFVWLSSYWVTRDLASAVKSYLDFHGVPSTYVEQAGSKISDSMNFVLNNLVAPNTYFVENSQLIEHIEDIETCCEYPMIMKESKGCGGENSSYITKRSELIDYIYKRRTDKKYFFQSYIENDYDWGILVANGVVVSGERSYPSAGEFRNNVGAQEKFEKVKNIPENIKDMAINASIALGLTWSRSDIIIDRKTGNPYLLEVNRFPGITNNSTEVTGARTFLKTSLEINNLIPTTQVIPLVIKTLLETTNQL